MKNLKQLITIIALFQISYQYNLWPQPQQIQSSDVSEIDLQNKAQSLNFQVQQDSKQEEIPSYIIEIIEFYCNKVFGDSSEKVNIHNGEIIKKQFIGKNDNQINININIKNWDLEAVYTTKEESFTLNSQKQNNVNIETESYFGFLRALETFFQFITKNKKGEYKLETGFDISDEPQYFHRGILIDVSRHYLSLDLLKKYTDSMMYNKVNVLHIHFSDDPSMPLQLEKYPDISENSAFTPKSQYTKDEIQELIQYAMTRGVRIIPEVTSPYKTYSWSAQEDIKNINILCEEPIDGQLDPTLDLTYEVIEGIFGQINEQFPDQYVHFGGKKAQNDCYDKRPEIKQFMEKNNIENYDQLQKYYRDRQREIWRNNIKSNKQNTIYWAGKTNIDLGIEPTDVLEFIGNSDEISVLQDYENQIIVCHKDKFSLAKGFGTISGEEDPMYNTWLELYQDVNLEEYNDFKGQIIGAELALWGELNTDQTLFTKTWIRASSMAERTWNTKANNNQLNNVVLLKRLQAQLVRMQQRGIPTSPLTTQYCTNNPEVCFYNH